MDDKPLQLQFMGSGATKRTSLIPIIVTGVGLYALYKTNWNEHSTVMALRLVAFATLAVLAFASILTLVESLTVYETDSDGITRIAWNGARRVRWAQISRFRMRGAMTRPGDSRVRGGTLSLGDNEGRKLTVYFAFIGADSRSALLRIVKPYLESVQQAKQNESAVSRSK
jgi:hypothetical protein